jgi:hypothetical protein
MRQKTFLASVATAALIGSGAMAAGVSITQIDAAWQNPIGSAFPTNGNINNSNADNVVIEWGTPTTIGGSRSGYSFQRNTDTPFPASPFNPLDPTTIYSLGTFTHFNNPIFESGGDLTSVELAFSFGGIPDGGSFTGFNAVFDFGHNETLNTDNVGQCVSPLQESPVPCDDIVTVTAEGGATEDVRVGDLIYTFRLLGFSEDGINFDENSNIFVTQEGQPNARDLYFNYTVSVVPLPASGWLLLAGLGGLAAVGRRRRKAS